MHWIWTGKARARSLYVAACSAGDNISPNSKESGEPDAFPLVEEPVR